MSTTNPDDLALPPSSPHGEHDDVTCDQCQICPIQGIRYRCSMCANYDLCESCIVTLEGEISRADLGVGIFHDASHVFYRVPSSSSAWGRSKFGFGSGNMSMPIACYPIIVNRSNARHVGVTCSICRKQDPEGYLYQCQPCTAAATAFGPNTDIDAFQFCEACEAKGCHAPDHPRVKIAVPKIRVKTPSAELAESRAEVSRLKAQLEEMELEKAKAKGKTPEWSGVKFGMIHRTSGREGDFTF